MQLHPVGPFIGKNMEFHLSLIKVPSIKKMTGLQVFDLMVNARHVRGDYWIFEGDPLALLVNAEIFTEGIGESYGDLNDDELIDYCKEVFNEDLSKEPQPFEMY